MSFIKTILSVNAGEGSYLQYCQIFPVCVLVCVCVCVIALRMLCTFRCIRIKGVNCTLFCVPVTSTPFEKVVVSS